jgi:hypothetical protein
MAYPDGTIVSALAMVSGIFQKAQNPKTWELVQLTWVEAGKKEAW